MRQLVPGSTYPSPIRFSSALVLQFGNRIGKQRISDDRITTCLRMLVAHCGTDRLVAQPRHVLGQRCHLSVLGTSERRRPRTEKSSLPTSFADFLNTFWLNTRSLRWQPPRTGANTRATWADRRAFASSRMCGGIVTVRCSPFFVVSIRQRSAPGVFGSARCVTPREMVTTVQSAAKSRRRSSVTSPNRIPHQPASSTRARKREVRSSVPSLSAIPCSSTVVGILTCLRPLGSSHHARRTGCDPLSRP